MFRGNSLLRKGESLEEQIFKNYDVIPLRSYTFLVLSSEWIEIILLEEITILIVNELGREMEKGE